MPGQFDAVLGQLSELFLRNTRRFRGHRVFSLKGAGYVFSGSKHNKAPVFHDATDADEWIFVGDDGFWHLNKGDSTFSTRLRGPCQTGNSAFVPGGDTTWAYVLQGRVRASCT
jgi:hypothetical protein